MILALEGDVYVPAGKTGKTQFSRSSRWFTSSGIGSATVERLATRLHAKVMLLHVIEQHAPTTIYGERHLTGVAEAQLYLEETAIQLRSSGIPVETHVHEEKEDNVARSIVEHARESKIDLIIMCTHGRGGLRDSSLAASPSKLFDKVRSRSCSCFQERMAKHQLSISDASLCPLTGRLPTNQRSLLP